MEQTIIGLDRRVSVRPGVPHNEKVPTVTVVIPCYNYARYLPQAVQSGLNQTSVAVDVIIVDDASTDISLLVARRLANQYSNGSILTHHSNSGMVETFNDGARAARGEFLVRLDADDVLTPGSLERATLLARAFPAVGLIYGHPLHFSTEALPKPIVAASLGAIWPGREWLKDRCRFGHNVITSPEVLMRRSLLEQVGYQSLLRHTPDMELWLRISAFADVAYIHGADQAWHREHRNSMSAREVDELLDLQERRETFDVLFSGPAGTTKEAAQFKVLAAEWFITAARTKACHGLDRGVGASRTFEYCLRLAQELDPAIRESPVFRKLIRRAARRPLPSWAQPAALGRRLRGRLKSEIRSWRWHRNGVF